MPFPFFSRIARQFRPQKPRATRSKPTTRQVHYAETLEDRRMLSATELVADINQQAPPIGYETGIVVDGTLYFIGRSFVHSNSSSFGLWKYDPGANNGNGELTPYENATVFHLSTSNMVELDGKIYFQDGGGVFMQFDPSANSGDGHLESLITSPPARINWNLRQLTVVGDDLIYRSIDNAGDLELWRYRLDEGISRLAVISMGTTNTELVSKELVVAGGKLYFHVPGADGELQLWKYDPNLSDEDAVEQVVGNLFSPDVEPTLAELDGNIYFVAEDQDRNVLFWAYDTENSTLNAVSEMKFPTLSHDIATTDARVYVSFDAYSGHPPTLWEYDPLVTDGPSAVGEIAEGNSLPWGLAGIGDELYFYATSQSGRQQLWKFVPDNDIGDGETTFVTDIGKGSLLHVDPRATLPVSKLGSLIYYQVSGIGFGDTLWVYEASANDGDGKTDAIREDVTGTDTSEPAEFTVSNGKLFFTANDTIHGYELWEYDPDGNLGVGALSLAADINPGGEWSYPANLTLADGMLYFSASDGNALAIWQFDTMTSSLRQISEIVDATNIRDLLVVGDRVYVSAATQFHNYKVLYYDLTAPIDTTSFQYIPEPDEGLYTIQSDLVALGGDLYFVGFRSGLGQDLFRFDTEANAASGATLPLEGLDEVNVYPEAVFSSQGKIYFRGRTSEHGAELWEYDLSGGGIPRMIANLNPGSASSDIWRLTEIGSEIYFLTNYGENDFRLWSYDPAANNGQGELTAVVKSEFYNFASATYLSYFGQLPYQGHKIYLDIRNASGRDEIWEYDIKSGSFRKFPGGATDLWGGDLKELTPLGDRLYFVGLNIEIGNELFAVDIPPPQAVLDLVFSVDTTKIPGVIYERTLPEILPEWDAPSAQLWVRVAANTPSTPFDLEVSLDMVGTWFGEPSVNTCLGTGGAESVSDEDGQRTYTLTINDVDLSSYEVGDRILVANIDFPLDPENTIVVPMDGQGSYPAPTSEHGVTLVSAVNASTSDPFDVLPEVSGQFMPMVYDTNDDGKVGLADFTEFIANYGKVADMNSPQAYRLDFNQDGKVGLADFALFISHYGQRKFPPASQVPQALSIESKPISRSSLSSASYLLEAEPAPSIYWGKTSELPSESIVSDSFNEEEQDFVEIETTQFTAADHSWDVRIVDAAIRSSECFLTTPEEAELDLDETYLAGL